MAIFTAGCIESTSNSKKIRSDVYTLAKQDLDSPGMKISVRKSPTCINYIAFLPKEKLSQENILKAVSESIKPTVVIFELDYKQVGVVCENSRIIDYILDKPEDFALERGYATRIVDNSKGVKLVFFNLNQDNRETWAGSISLGFTIVLTSVIFYSGYFYMKDIPVSKVDKKTLVEQYKRIVKKEFARTETAVGKVDMVDVLEDIEKLMQATNSTLRQVKYDKKKYLVEVNTVQTDAFIAMLPKNTKVKHTDSKKGIVQYYYEKI
jgi:hypothetical protein